MTIFRRYGSSATVTDSAEFQLIDAPSRPAGRTRKKQREALWAQTAPPFELPPEEPGPHAPAQAGMARPEASGKYQTTFLGNVQNVVQGDHMQVTVRLGPGPEAVKPPITVLFLAANPSSTSRLAIDEEIRAIEQKVRAAEYRDALVFQTAWAVQPDDLLQLLNQYRPQVVHFSGHGSREGLYLAGGNGQVKLVSTSALQALFATLKDAIRLIFLNACYSREQAQALVNTIGCVIGMKASIGDRAATAFASSFYRAIGFGRSVQEAFEQGIASLMLEGIPQEDIPDLLVKDGVDASRLLLIPPARS